MLPLRLVLDTNIMVSALIKPDGLQKIVLTIALTQPARLSVSPDILEEYRMVLDRPKFAIRKGARRQFFQLLRTRARRIAPTRKLAITVDPKDNLFLECAKIAGADYLVTGNLRHFPPYWGKRKVISSREFSDLIAPHLTA
jgi:putative PIN family toxin of toxin-antitoxin system